MKTYRYLKIILFCTLVTTLTLLSACKKDKDQPVINAVTPNGGGEGDEVVIDGMFLSKSNTVNFGTVATTIIVDPLATEITTVVPPGLTLGATTISVQTDAGTSNTLPFTVLPPGVNEAGDSLPRITDLKPAVSYKSFPVMIRGKHLKNVTGVKIGTSDATIVSAYDKNIVVILPSDLNNATYSVRVITGEGTSNAGSLNVVTAPSGVGSPPGGSFMTPPPANYVNAVSNVWSAFFLTTGTVACPLKDNNDDTFCGHYYFTKDGSGKVTSNYMEFTRGSGDAQETFYGQWSASVAQPCTQKLDFISAKDGHTLSATVKVDGFIYDNGQCQ